MALLAPGDRAPDFTLRDQNGRNVNLSDFRGRTLLLFFCPNAHTTDCTTQACSVRDALPELLVANASTLGVCIDPPSALKNFDEKYNLTFSFLSDTDHKVSELFGAWQRKTVQRRGYSAVVRSAFLIDKKGRITHAWYRIRPTDTAPLALKALKAAASP